MKQNKPVNSEEGEADHGAVDAEGEDSHLQRAPGSKHIRLFPANDKFTGRGSPVLGDKAENEKANEHCCICHGQVCHENE